MILLNNQITALLQIGGDSENPVWGDLGGAFKSVAQSMGESKYTASYLADGGFSSSEVTGLSFSLTLTGDYMPDNDVVKYLFSEKVLYGVGDARKSRLKITRGGVTVLWDVTISKITETGGDANEPDGISVELLGNGRPQVVDAE